MNLTSHMATSQLYRVVTMHYGEDGMTLTLLFFSKQ
ncbi:MAG: hypothetical protein JWO03_3879 [Bacteroidetes bacterium]|nr:hypothetical protein [Bacteroidota bacterium]